jgi:hypothetical protein
MLIRNPEQPYLQLHISSISWATNGTHHTIITVKIAMTTPHGEDIEDEAKI